MRRRSGFGWLELVIGILLIALGVLTLAKPDIALTGLVFAYGLAAIIMGVADIILYVQIERYTGIRAALSLIAGILSVMSGIVLVVYPRTGVLVLSVLFPIWFIGHCISRLTQLDHIRFVAGSGTFCFVLIVNIIGLILGFLMLLRPVFTIVTLRYFASFYLILLGVDSIVMAFSRVGTRR